MFKKDEGLFLVYHNGYYMSSRDYKTVDALSLDSDIKEATVFNSLKRATFWAKKIGGNVLIYSRDASDEVHP